MPEAICKHCGWRKAAARGICNTCHRNPEILAKYPALRPMRVWTAKERDYLVRNWGRLSRDEIGRQLGRSACSVQQAAAYFGVSRKHKHLDDYEPRIRNLHTRGKTNGEIARQLGLS